MSSNILTEKQKIVWRETLRGEPRRWNFQSGAVSSGKTYVDFFRIPKRIRATKGLGAIVIMGNTQATIERNVLEPMRNIYGEEMVSRIRSNNEAELFGKKVYVIGANNKRQVDRIQGLTIEYAYGDEVGTWAEEVFTMLKSRLRTVNSVFDGTCNPDIPDHWLKKFLDSDADLYLMEYVIDDNTFLPKKYIEALKKEYEGTVWYDRFILGKWRAASGLIYPMVQARMDDFIVKANPFSQGKRYYASIDYGTINPFVILLWSVEGNKATIEKEYYWDSKARMRQKTDEEYYEDMERFLEGYHIQKIVIDPSASSFIQTIRKYRKYRVSQAENDVDNGLRITASMINGGMIYLNQDCINTKREFGIYSWDESIRDKDKPLKENDHAMDAMRYFVSTILSKEFKWIQWRSKA